MPATSEKKTTRSLADPSERIRVLIGERTRIGCDLFRKALVRARFVQSIGFATTVDQVVTEASTSEPHILLLSRDLEDGPATGLKALQRLNGIRNSCRVVMMFESGEPNDVIECFRAGAKGIFRRSESLENLLRCVSVVHSGQIWASSADLNLALEALTCSGRSFRYVNSSGEELLTAREQEVVKLVAEGCPNREISQRLNITEHTVKNYLFKIYDKLGISTRVELTLYATSRYSYSFEPSASDPHPRPKGIKSDELLTAVASRTSR